MKPEPRKRFRLTRLVVLIGLACLMLPSIHAFSQDTVRTKLLERQARHFLHLVQRDVQLAEDAEIVEYVLNLANHLAQHANMDSDPLRYFVVVDSGINAFAGPGATFFINSGLIEKAHTEGELASVVAHELAHFKQDHLNRLTQNYTASRVPLLISILAGIAVGGDAGLATVVGAQAAAVESMIEHTLSYEREADAVGLQILTASGYSPEHAANLMLRLENFIREQGVIQSNIHNTHPITPERIAAIKQRISNYPNIEDRHSNADFYFAQAKTRVLYSFAPGQTYKFFEQRLAEGTVEFRLAMRYGLALSLAKDGKTDQARTLLENLAAAHPKNPWIVLAQADLELDSHNPQAGAAALADLAQSDHPGNAVIEKYALALAYGGDSEEATRYIRKWMALRPQQITLLSAYARIAAESGQFVDGSIAAAERAYQTGNLQRAHKLLKGAQAKSVSFYSSELIREKLRIIEDELAWRSS